MAGEWNTPRLTADVGSDVVDGPPRYARRATGPIRYAPVRRGDTVLAYVWVADDQDAAHHRPRRGR